MSNAKLIVVTLVAGLMLTGSAYAYTTDLRAAATAETCYMEGWKFEGSDVSTAGAPIVVGGVGLVETLHGATNDIVYDVPGWDSSSKASSTYRVVPGGDMAGENDGFKTDPAEEKWIAPPTRFAYDVVIKTGAVPIDGGTWDLGYVIAHRVAGGPRGYFLWQGTMGGGHDPDTFPQGGDGFSSLTGGWTPACENTILTPLAANNWYYVATCYEVDTGALPDDHSDDTTVVDSYIADLTAGQTTLTHTTLTITGLAQNSYDYNVPGTFGIGDRFDGSGETFPGVLDEVYLYGSNEQVCCPDFQAHLDALLIPEPATMTLLLLGGALVTARRRRRK